MELCFITYYTNLIVKCHIKLASGRQRSDEGQPNGVKGPQAFLEVELFMFVTEF